jgi:hypothetical protein
MLTVAIIGKADAAATAAGDDAMLTTISNTNAIVKYDII